jgi:hypothetical protein
MATRRRLAEKPGDALMERWFWMRRGEIGAGVGAVDSGGTLVALFIGS